MKFSTMVLATLFIASCSVVSKREAEPAPVSIKSELSKIEIDIAAGAYKKATKRLENIIANNGQTDAADDAYIMLGKIYYQQSDYTSSYKAYISVINSEYFSPRELDASLGAAKALIKLGRYDEALSLTGRALKDPQASPSTRIETYMLRFEIQSQLGDRLDALRSIVYLAENVTDAGQKERYKIKAAEFVDSNLRDEDLKIIAEDKSFGLVRTTALFRVALNYFEQKDYSRAEQYFQNVIELSPGSDASTSAANYIEQISARRRVSPFTIGAVLPITGKHSTIAQKTLRGLQLGLGIYGNNPSNFKLAVVDSAANPDVARRAIERLVVEDSAIAVVGDLISRTAEPVALKAEELGVPIIGLSQKSGLTQIGENVFRNSLTSAAIVRELVTNAIDKYGIKKFAILYPNDPYGVEYANLFWDEVLLRGGTIAAAQTYAAGEKDFRAVIARLTGTYYIEDRTDEYTHLVRSWYGQQKVITSRVTPPTDLLTPIIDFEAIFIPDGVKALGQIASMLIYNEVSGVRLLGTNLWNTPTLVERGTSLIENSLFVDAKSSVDNSLSRTAFYRDYQKMYGEAPSQFEAQAYDTGLALRHLIERGAKTRVALRESLSGLQNLSGTEGPIMISPDREFNRPLTLLTVKDKKIEPANTASSSKKY